MPPRGRLRPAKAREPCDAPFLSRPLVPAQHVHNARDRVGDEELASEETLRHQALGHLNVPAALGRPENLGRCSGLSARAVGSTGKRRKGFTGHSGGTMSILITIPTPRLIDLTRLETAVSKG